MLNGTMNFINSYKAYEMSMKNKEKICELSEITYYEVDKVVLNAVYDLLVELGDFSADVNVCAEISTKVVREVEYEIKKYGGIIEGELLNGIPYRENKDMPDNILKLIIE